MGSSQPELAADDAALLDRVAERVVELHLELPAILTLETGKPLSLLAGQTMVFFEPLVQSLFRFSDYRRFAALIERREVIETLILTIETKAEQARQRRGAGPTPGPGGNR